jgi:dienelactone hydrolase
MFWRIDIKAEEGPFKVLLKKGEFVDATRDGRKVPYKIYYPVDHGLDKRPVIVWSHGFGGNKDGAGFISRYVASHGYTIIHVTHAGSDSSLWEGKGGHPWDVLRKISLTREMTLARFKDIPFMLNQLPQWAQENPEAGAALDLDMLGMSGHSFGAMTTQAMAGELFQDEDGHLRGFADDRFKAAIAYSPVPIRELTHENPEPYIYGPIKLPMLHMTGTQDISPLDGYDYRRRLAVYEHSGSEEKYLVVLKDGDHMVYNGTRGKLEENPLRPLHEEIIKIASLAFWEAYLKGDQAAKQWLQNGGFSAYLGEAGEFRYSGL